MNITISEYLLYLYIYSFIGWVYESTLDSIQTKKFVNRGFMHGPFLPIYGSGAIIIIFIGSFANGKIWEVFLFSTIFCTVMELCTGLTMEKLFKVRYWDYRQIPGNIKGYIAPPISIFWGVLALLLNIFIHPFICTLLEYIPSRILEMATYALTIYLTSDFTLSFIESMDLRRTLEEIAKNNKDLRKFREVLTERREDISINLMSLKDYTHALQIETKNALNLKLSEMKKNSPRQFKHAVNVLKRNPATISTKYVKELKQFLKRH